MEGRACRAVGAGWTTGDFTAGSPRRLPFIKASAPPASRRHPEAKQGVGTVGTEGNQGDQVGAGVPHCSGDRDMPGGEETLDLPAWNRAQDPAWGPHHRLVLPWGVCLAAF